MYLGFRVVVVSSPLFFFSFWTVAVFVIFPLWRQPTRFDNQRTTRGISIHRSIHPIESEILSSRPDRISNYRPVPRTSQLSGLRLRSKEHARTPARHGSETQLVGVLRVLRPVPEGHEPSEERHAQVGHLQTLTSSLCLARRVGYIPRAYGGKPPYAGG